MSKIKVSEEVIKSFFSDDLSIPEISDIIKLMEVERILDRKPPNPWKVVDTIDNSISFYRDETGVHAGKRK